MYAEKDFVEMAILQEEYDSWIDRDQHVQWGNQLHKPEPVHKTTQHTKLK